MIQNYLCFKQLPSNFTRISVVLKIIPRARLLLDVARCLMLSSNNALDFYAETFFYFFPCNMLNK